MPFKLKILISLPILTVITFTFYFLTFNFAHAQVPPPTVPCNQVRPDLLHPFFPISPLNKNTEFHSLRPYQASPCQVMTNDYAKFCGNTLTLQDKIDVTYQPGVDNCTPLPGGKVRCSYVKPISETITIDLSNAKLPIMGNTENVINSQNSNETLNDADKVNGYVSWYLNGTVNRAEYPPLDVGADCIGNSQEAGVCLNTGILGTCTLPVPIIQGVPDVFLSPDGGSTCTGTKVCCVAKNLLGKKVTILDRDKLINYSGPLNKLLPQEIKQQQQAQTVKDAYASRYSNANIRHDQIIGCTYGIPTLFGQAIAIPGPCYEEGLISVITLPFRKERRLSEWIDHLPPKRADYPSYVQYESALETWRGKTCATVYIPTFVPIIGGKGIIFCFDIGLNPNYYSELYPYIPLSSTEDVEGNIQIDSVSVGGPGITNVSFGNQTPATLFFPHLTESDQLGSSLQDTYIAKDEAKTGAATEVEPPSSCTTVDVRSNQGDTLVFPNQPTSKLTGDLGYTATFTCDFNATPASGSCEANGGYCAPSMGECGADTCGGAFSCSPGDTCCKPCTSATPAPLPPQTCSKTVSIALSTSSNTPKIDDIWSRLVAGPTAVVKRMFPKLGTQIGTLKDMPGSTSITYTGAQASSGELNLPHVGGISEYFLKGIQTLLRPKGYGEPISFGSTTGTTTIPDDVCAIATKYNIPCCQLEGIMEVETGNGALIGSGSCTRNGTTFNCCTGNFCGPANISCNQYSGLTNSDNLDMCTENGAAELLARAMLLALCQADANIGKIPAGTCNSYDWSTWGSYVLQHYSIQDGNYTAAAYFYGLGHGCAVDACSQFRWGAGMGYCDAVEYYCKNGTPLNSSPDGSFCKACNATIPAGSPKIDCSLYP